jgi:hypothetical protein
MDFKALLAAPLAAVVMTVSATELRMPSGWIQSATFTYPVSTVTYESGVDPAAEEGGQRALTVKAVGSRKADDIGAVGQFAMGYAGKRARLSGQVRAAGVDGWAGLAVGRGFVPLAYLKSVIKSPDEQAYGAAACPQWCAVDVVVDVPADGDGVVSLGLVLMGNGQVWGRNFRLEVVAPSVPLTTVRVGPDFPAVQAAQRRQEALLKAYPAVAPDLGLD